MKKHTTKLMSVLLTLVMLLSLLPTTALAADTYWIHIVIREINRDANLLINTAEKLHLPEKFFGALHSIEEEMKEGKLKQVPIRFIFYNLYSLLSIPFLSQDLTYSLLLDENESFEDMLNDWKPYIVSQMENLLEIR